jgi:hypothetical protein
MLGPIKANQWAMDTAYELLWCIVIDITTHNSLTLRPQQLGSFKIYLLRGPTTILYFLQGSRVVFNTDASHGGQPGLGARATRTERINHRAYGQI